MYRAKLRLTLISHNVAPQSPTGHSGARSHQDKSRRLA
jgi:hypothetical protein